MKQKRKDRRALRLRSGTLLVALAGLLLIASGCSSTGEEGGYQYRITRGMAEITAYTGEGTTMDVPPALGDLNVVQSIAPGAIPENVIALSLPAGCTVSAETLEQAENLKYLFLEAESEAPSLPEGCKLLRWGGAYADGRTITGYHADEAGALYALLDDGTAALLSIPAGVREYEVPLAVGNMKGVVYTIDGSALDVAEDLVSLTLGSVQDFPVEMLDRLLALDNFSYPDESYTSDYVLTAKAASRINAAREEQGLYPIRPDRQTIEAARVRMRELGETYSFARPDISSGYTALTDAGVTYQAAAQFRWHGADKAEMEESLLQTIVEDALTEEVLFYDGIGLSSGYGPYNEDEAYVMYGFLTDSTTRQLTFSGVNYEVTEDILQPISIAEGALSIGLYKELYGKPVGDLPEGFFDGGENLQAVFLDQLSPHGDQIPDSYLVVREGTDTGDGEAVSIYVDDSGCTYVFTDRDRYVLWDIPADLTDVIVSARIYGYPVTYIAPRAVKGSRELVSLHLSDLCGFPPEELAWYVDHVVGIYSSETLTYPEGDSAEVRSSAFYSIISTDILRTYINKLREGKAEFTGASYELLTAARILAAEQPEQFGTTRPDGSSWITALDEAHVEDWENGRILIRRCSDSAEVGAYLGELAEEYAYLQEGGYLYRNVAVALHQSGEDFYVVALGTVS